MVLVLFWVQFRFFYLGQVGKGRFFGSVLRGKSVYRVIVVFQRSFRRQVLVLQVFIRFKDVSCFRRLLSAGGKRYVFCRWRFLMKFQGQVLIVLVSFILVFFLGSWKFYLFSLGVENLIYLQKNLVKKGKFEFYLFVFEET